MASRLRELFGEYFLGRDVVSQNFERPFLRIPADLPDESRKAEHDKRCKELVGKYKYSCNLSMKAAAATAKVDSVSLRETRNTLHALSVAVIGFVNVLRQSMERQGKLTIHQSAAVIKISKFLRSCVAGRVMFSKHCEPADRGHMHAMRTFNQALTSLEEYKLIAVQLVSDHKKKKKKKNNRNKNKKTASQLPSFESENIFEQLSQAFGDIDRAIDDLNEEDDASIDPDSDSPFSDDSSDHTGEAKTPHEVYPSSTGETSSIDDAFLNKQLEVQIDSVHETMQSDFAEDVSQMIWEDGKRDLVYPPHGLGDRFREKRFGLPTHLVVLKLLPYRNHTLLYDVMTYLYDVTVQGVPPPQSIQVFSAFQQLLASVQSNTPKMGILHTLRANFLTPRIALDGRPCDGLLVVDSQSKLEDRMKLVISLAKSNPLIISYMGFSLNFSVLFFAAVGPKWNLARKLQMQRFAKTFMADTRIPALQILLARSDSEIFENGDLKAPLMRRLIKEHLEESKHPNNTPGEMYPDLSELSFVFISDQRAQIAGSFGLKLPCRVQFLDHEPEVDRPVSLYFRDPLVFRYAEELHATGHMQAFLPLSDDVYYTGGGYGMNSTDVLEIHYEGSTPLS